jgi:hypothetical protein
LAGADRLALACGSVHDFAGDADDFRESQVSFEEFVAPAFGLRLPAVARAVQQNSTPYRRSKLKITEVRTGEVRVLGYQVRSAWHLRWTVRLNSEQPWQHFPGKIWPECVLSSFPFQGRAWVRLMAV